MRAQAVTIRGKMPTMKEKPQPPANEKYLRLLEAAQAADSSLTNPADVGRAIGYHTNAVGNWRTRGPSRHAVQKAAALLCVNPRWVEAGELPMLLPRGNVADLLVLSQVRDKTTALRDPNETAPENPTKVQEITKFLTGSYKPRKPAPPFSASELLELLRLIDQFGGLENSSHLLSERAIAAIKGLYLDLASLEVAIKFQRLGPDDRKRVLASFPPDRQP